MTNNWSSRSPPRITIVEDEIMVSIHLEDLLRENAYQIARTAMNTSEALRTIPKDQPDAVLVDLDLVDNRAFEIPRELLLRNTPFVAMTAYPARALLDPVLRGASFLQKPWKEEHVLRELNHVLAHRQTVPQTWELTYPAPKGLGPPSTLAA